jgi:hypothetical protein
MSITLNRSLCHETYIISQVNVSDPPFFCSLPPFSGFIYYRHAPPPLTVVVTVTYKKNLLYFHIVDLYIRIYLYLYVIYKSYSFLNALFRLTYCLPVPVTARSESWFCGRSFPGIGGSIPAGDMDVFQCECCVLSGRGLCYVPNTRPEECHRVWCCSLSVIVNEEALAHWGLLRCGGGGDDIVYNCK